MYAVNAAVGDVEHDLPVLDFGHNIDTRMLTAAQCEAEQEKREELSHETFRGENEKKHRYTEAGDPADYFVDVRQ
jgi:hypothetical protein